MFVCLLNWIESIVLTPSLHSDILSAKKGRLRMAINFALHIRAYIVVNPTTIRSRRPENVSHDYIYIIVTDMEGNIRIYRLPKGRGTDQWKWYLPSQRRGHYNFHWSVPRPKGSLSILILHSISVTIVFIALKNRIWHIQYKCIEIFNQDHWSFP